MDFILSQINKKISEGKNGCRFYKRETTLGCLGNAIVKEKKKKKNEPQKEEE